MSRLTFMKMKRGNQYIKRLFSSFILICLLFNLNISSVSAASPRMMENGKSMQSAAQSDFSLTSPVSSDQTLTVIHGYNSPPPGQTCDIGNKLGIAATIGDHCLHQKYGLDLRPSNLSDKNILAPLPGKINWMDDVTKVALPCLGILTEDHLNLTICHFGKFNVNLHDKVLRGQNLGTRNTDWIHLSLDDRYDNYQNQKPQDQWIPIPFSGVHTIEGKSFDIHPETTVGLHEGEEIQPAGGNASASSTALVFDVSGSMGETDSSGVIKLQAAKSAGGNILDIIAAENKASGANDNQVAIVSFSVFAHLDMSLTSDITMARNALNGLSTVDTTAMAAGLQTAIGALANITLGGKPMIILLSDGMPNVDLSGGGDETSARQDTLDQAKQAGQKGICVYTVGFGNPSASGNAGLDEDFLRQVAVNSGCGSYYNAQNSTQLANIYVQLRHSSTGTILFNQTGTIAQGQQIDIGTTNIPSNQALALFTLNWPGSRLDALLTDPAGRLVDDNYPGASISTANTIVSIILQNPKAGQWKIGAKGVDVPEGTTDYNAILSVRSNTATAVPPSSGIPIVLLIVAGGGVLVYAISRSNRRATPALRARSVYAYLVGLSGAALNQTFALSDGALIGRGSTCRIRLTEPSVSRQHARLRVAQGAWFIQDLNSTYGTYVNGQRISATRLKNGDRIRIGSTELEFRM